MTYPKDQLGGVGGLSSASASTMIATQLTPYISSASVATALGGYITSASVASMVAGYLTSASANLGQYVTSGSLNTALAPYLTSASAALSTYVTSGSLATALSPYITSNSASVALATKAALSQTDFISGIIASPANQDYRIVEKLPYAIVITEVATKSSSGVCTVTGKINSTALGGTPNSVTSTQSSQAHSSSNTAASGDVVVLTVSSASACVDLSFAVKFTRTLA
jgi:hypothetical protein